MAAPGITSQMFCARFFILKGGAVAPLVITPRRKELGRDLIILVPYNLPDEGKLLLRNLIPNHGNVKEYCAD